jgi:uncharacterized protein (DUF58 family)
MAVHLTRVKTRMSIHAHRKVRGLLEGEYAALHAGRSMDFNDLREYVRGDDVKDIEWKASARTRSLLVKRYAALRQHTIMFAVSTGRSMAAMNDQEVEKRRLSVLVTGMIGYLAVRNGDVVALAHGNAAEQHQAPPAKGELGLERHLEAIHEATTPESAPADLSALLEYVIRTVRRRTILVVVSDEHAVDDRLARALRRLAVQHEVMFVTVGDLDPTSFAHDYVDLVDIDTGARVPEWMRTDEKLQREYADLLTTDAHNLARTLDTLGIVHAHVHDEASVLRTVFGLLETHRHARRR